MEAAAWVQAWATVAAVLVAVVGVWVAYTQLKQLNQAARMSHLMAVLQIEAELNSRQEKLDEISLLIQQEDVKEAKDLALIGVWGDYLESRKERLLNAADRLCFCIKNGYLPDKDWRVEYREFVLNLVRAYPERFGAGSIYNNIIDVNNLWQRT